jgi:hypothetical protein
MAQQVAEETSELFEAIKARPRKVYRFPANDLVGLSGDKIHEVAVRVATKREQDLAVAGAHAYVAKLAEKNPRVADDPDVLLDAKSCYILATVLRDPARPDKMPLFPTGETIAERLSTEQIAALVSVANQVRRQEAPDPDELNDETLETVLSICSAAVGTELPEAVLARFSRVKLEQLTIRMAVELEAARKALAASEG